MAKKKATSMDVAREAGVSQATVSMILNKKYNVSFSKETIRQVTEAAEKLDYHLPKQRIRRSAKSRKLNSQIRILENYKGNLLTVQQKDANGNWSAASVTDQQEIIQTADPQKPRIIHHFMLDSYQTQISSSYSLNGVQNYYQLTLTAELLAEQQEDGTFHYTLFLPDAEQMDNGAGTTITNENFSLTDQVSAETNVVSDIWPTGLAGEDTSQKPKEQPYVKSDETQILFQ